MRYSLRTLLVLVTLFAACLASHRAYQLWHAWYYPSHALNSLLSTSVHNGDNWQDVARYFKEAAKVDVSNDPNVLNVWKSRQFTIRPDDEIWHFRHSSRHGVWLQFREGKVVNFQASDFADPDSLTRLNNRPLPPILLRRGVWPYGIALLVVASCVLVALDRKMRVSS